MSYRPRVPVTFGDLGLHQGLLFSCASCTRATLIPPSECVRRWGQEGNITEVAKRFGCSNCRSKGRPRRGARVEIAMVRDETRTVGERTRRSLDPVDRLVHDIKGLKPSGKVK